VLQLKQDIEERTLRTGEWLAEHRATVRAAAKEFGVSKSTVHKDLHDRLPRLNQGLYLQVKAVLDENRAERHLRGGDATRRKYKGEEG
jgi:putative DeoR family transcriptional regulator (stage III sporulation protein D)